MSPSTWMKNVFGKYGEKARAVLDALLQKYADSGIASVESMEILKVDPLTTFGGAGVVKIARMQELLRFICERGFDTELVSFVRSYGSKELDASLLLLPAIGFLPADDPRIRSTVASSLRMPSTRPDMRIAYMQPMGSGGLDCPL